MSSIAPLTRTEACESQLNRVFEQELDTAVTAEQRGQKVYKSLQQLSQLIGEQVRQSSPLRAYSKRP